MDTGKSPGRGAALNFLREVMNEEWDLNPSPIPNSVLQMNFSKPATATFRDVIILMSGLLILTEIIVLLLRVMVVTTTFTKYDSSLIIITMKTKNKYDDNIKLIKII